MPAGWAGAAGARCSLCFTPGVERAPLPFLSCPLPHANKQAGAGKQLTASDAKVDCDSLCLPALLKGKEKAMFLSSLVWGQREGRGGEAALSTLSPLVGAKQRKPDFSKCMNISFHMFLPFPGHRPVAGTVKEARTPQRCSQDLFVLLFPSLCLPVLSGEKEKWKNGWHLHLPSSRDDAVLQQSSALKPHEDRAGHTEKLWLLGVRRLQPEVHPATVYPQLMLPQFQVPEPWEASGGNGIQHLQYSEADHQSFKDLSRSSLILFSELHNDFWWHLPTTGSKHWWVL